MKTSHCVALSPALVLVVLGSSTTWAQSASQPAPTSSRAAPPAVKLASILGEHVQTLRIEPGVRVVIDPSPPGRPAGNSELILYALPNGNTIEWTAGKRIKPGDDWHFGIQHIGAQTRRLREAMPDRRISVAYLEADGKSWPGWKGKHPDYRELVPGIMDQIIARVPGGAKSLHLTGHSGGGSFVFGYIDSFKKIPDVVERISFLDSDYAYSDDAKYAHGDKLVEWLKRDPGHVLCVICYDDRKITLNGKPVLKNPLGGTWGSTHRMMDRLSKDIEIRPVKAEGYERYQGLNGRVDIIIHPNPGNKILHTELVRWNGFIHAVTTATPLESKAGVFNGPREYEKLIQDGE